jgi:aminoglycoside phosphotransferase family enzyme
LRIELPIATSGVVTEAWSVSIVESRIGDRTPSAPWLPAIQAAHGASLAVEQIETPLSWVFLTDQYAYKIKKPVNLGESRNWSAARRRQACLDEFWLNQRLAPGVYLGITPISEEADGSVRLGGRGSAIDYAVKMRKLRTDRSLLWLLQHNAITGEQITALARVLGQFYQGRPPETIGHEEYRRALQRRLTESASILKEMLPQCLIGRVQKLTNDQQKVLDVTQTTLKSRICDGRIVDGHGDLRAEHVFFERRPVVIDCIEYCHQLRRLDPLDDLARLDVDCERLNRADVGGAVLSSYRELTGDPGNSRLELLYKSLHAAAQAASILRRTAGNGRPKAVCMTEALIWLGTAQRYVASGE